MTATLADHTIDLVKELCNFPENDCLEFKRNNEDPDLIGTNISALANSAALHEKTKAYCIWGVEDQTKCLIGTTFTPRNKRIGNEEFESWLNRLLEPKINFRFHELSIDEKSIVLLEIDAASSRPIQFKNQEYIRFNSSTRKLKDFPEKERLLWKAFDRTSYEKQISLERVSAQQVLSLLDYHTYFELLDIPSPSTESSILNALVNDGMIIQDSRSSWNISNLGGILFGKNLESFPNLKRKPVRIIQYNGKGRFDTSREINNPSGYACSFKSIIYHILSLIPTNEVIEKALRKAVPMFPELAIRELVANAMIHQDLDQTGTGVLIEIFSDRIEITNPGCPLIHIDRFLDSPPKSRNEILASFLRRIGMCEERGSGVDKVVFQTELYQLPAPIFELTDEHVRVILFSHRPLREMNSKDKVHACYLHACLKYVQRDFMTNTSLRTRFGIEEQNSATVSRIIKDACEEQRIKPYDPLASKKYMKYIPHWA